MGIITITTLVAAAFGSIIINSTLLYVRLKCDRMVKED